MFLALTSNVAVVVIANGGVLWRLTLGAQLATYLLAITGLFSSTANRIHFVKLASAFLSLNWFIVLGFIEFLSNRNAHLWQNHQQPADQSRSTSSSR